MSANDRLERKKYMGVWRWGSEMMARMMARFPANVTMYKDRNIPKKRGCRSGSSESQEEKASCLVYFHVAVGFVRNQLKRNIEFTPDNHYCE